MDSCNTGCSCTTEFYDPVCDEQGTKYFSSCFAGCADVSEDGEVRLDFFTKIIECDNFSLPIFLS